MKINAYLSCFILFLSSTLFSQEITLSYQNYNPDAGSVEIWIDNPTTLLGGQFQVTGFHVTEVEMGNAIQGFVFLASNSSGFILTVGMEFEIIQGYNRYCTVNFDAVFSDTSFIVDPVFIDQNYDPFTNVNTNESLATGFCEIIGDLNSDSIMDILDIVRAVDCILSQSMCSCSDMNGDYEVDITDILGFVAIIIGE
ncbi:MAG: hypothetical protein H8D46_04365 [FCB group bacterium]|nr:hypothetical protein [FCB group bacterium]